MPEPSAFEIRLLHHIDEFRQCVEIQRLAWGFSDSEIVPMRRLVVCSKIGGQGFGAIDGKGHVLGFLNAYPGYRNEKVYLHSNMMGVRPEYQNYGIGRKLKLAQREEALSRRAIDLADHGDTKEVAALYAAEQALRLSVWSSHSGLASWESRKLKLEIPILAQTALNLARGRASFPRARWH